MHEVPMLITANFVNDDGELKELWRIDKMTSRVSCITMSRVAAGAGKAGAFVVRCGEPFTKEASIGAR
jgi:hypothetical protein